MTVVAIWDFAARRIYMDVSEYDPVEIYREHRAYRAADETSRKYKPLVRMIGGQAKGGGQRFGNALVVLEGAKIVPKDGTEVNIIQGEIITDDPDTDPDPFDSTLITADRPRIVLQPAAVLIEGGSALSAEQDSLLRATHAHAAFINKNTQPKG